MNYLISRLKEPSTWSGIAGLTLLGGIFTPQMISEMMRMFMSQEAITETMLILSTISYSLSIFIKEQSVTVKDASNINPSNPPI
jgi:hypothetical protein